MSQASATFVERDCDADNPIAMPRKETPEQRSDRRYKEACKRRKDEAARGITRRPRGRAPPDRRWDESTGAWRWDFEPEDAPLDLLPFRRTTLCIDFERKGRCNYGATCTNAHGMAELGKFLIPPTPAEVEATERYKEAKERQKEERKAWAWDQLGLGPHSARKATRALDRPEVRPRWSRDVISLTSRDATSES